MGFYLAIDTGVLQLHSESLFHLLGILIIINLIASIGMIVKGYSERNWFLVSRTRVFTFLIIFLIFITAAPAVCGIGAAAATVAVVAFISEFLLVNRNPFDQESRTRMQRIIDFFRGGAG